jgi:signal transduction histidine kinase
MKNDNFVLHIQEIELKTFIEKLTQKYSGMYGKNVILELSDGVVFSDEGSLLKIIENIYSNAIKYSKQSVKVKLKYENDMFHLHIEDDGRGIKESEREKIFELFEQTDNTVLTREHEGTGIGLYIVKLLCDKLKYSIAIDRSKLGGADFYIKGQIKNENISS